MIVETMALFSVDENAGLLAEDEIAEITGDYVMQGDNKLYPTLFSFDTNDLVVINKSQHDGYTAIRLKYGWEFTVKHDFVEVLNWFKNRKT